MVIGGGGDMRNILLIIVAIIPGCTSWEKMPYENFKQNYEGQIGRNVDDPSTSIARYPQKIIAERELKNGNKEIELLHAVSSIRDARCVVLYEIDAKTNVIVAWRYEGDEEICYWAP